MLWPGKRDLVGILVNIISVLMHITVVVFTLKYVALKYAIVKYVTVYVLILNSILTSNSL